MKNKSFTSLDIKSLYTNKLVVNCIKRLENHLLKTNILLLLLVSKLIKICTLCTLHCYFQHNNSFYEHKFGLSIGSPLRGVLACIYLKFLESGPFKCIILNNSNILRYIYGILLICPQEQETLFSHNHTFDFQNSDIFAFFHDKNKRRRIEACSIAHHNTIPHRQVLFQNFTIYRKNSI